MAYVVIENFSGGVDRTRPIYALANGTLWEGINGHLTRGGDFEKRKAFVRQTLGGNPNLPAGTFGLFAANGRLYTFGSAPLPAGFPFSIPTSAGNVFVEYVRLQHSNPVHAMAELLSVELFEGQIYAIARFQDDSIFHYHGMTGGVGNMVTEWNGAGAGFPTTKGVLAKTYKRKIYSPRGSILYFSNLDQPTRWGWVYNATTYPFTGGGFLNMANHQTGADTVTALAVYKSQLAVFSRRVVQLWNMEASAANNSQVQVITETGTRSPRAVNGFGEFDIFYLSDSGIRSLRAANYTNAAGVIDVGTPIDPLVRAQLDSLTEQTIASAVSTVEPVDGRFWLALGDKIFVFSYFPSKKISAWTWYEPGFVVSDFASIADRVWCRSGNAIYLYGGADNASYDGSVAVAQLPFISSRQQATYKQIDGFDCAVAGTWDVDLLFDPNDLTQRVRIGLMDNMSYNDPNTGAVGYGTHVAPRLVSQGSGYASISSVAIHFEGGDQE